MTLAALSAAALLSGLTASPLGPVPVGKGDVSIEAGQTIWHGDTGLYDLSGGVVVRRGTVVMRARTAVVNPDTGEVQATGDVLLLDSTRVMHADGIRAVLDGPFVASGVVGFEKAQPLELERVESLSEARHGRNRLTFSADRAEGDGKGQLRLEHARLTLCDCGEDRAPTWELGARRVKVEDGRAALSWPVFYITPRFLLVEHPVPVLILPWLSLPLQDRQTGFLFPEVGSTGTLGPYLAVPLFVTLGRSADLTVAPEVFFGPKNHANPGGAVEGPGVRLEVRWAPAERAEGLIELHLVQDLDRERIDAAPGATQPGGAGLRLSLQGGHAQSLGEGTRLTSQLALSQDPFMFRDFHDAQMPDDASYARSAALLSHARDAYVLEGSTAYLEPLVSVDRNDGSGSYRPGAFGWFGAQAPATQRWPSASASLLRTPVGPLEVEGRVGLSRYAPLLSAHGEVLPTDPSFHTLDAATLGVSEREAVTRGDARLQLSAPFLLGRTLSVEPYVRGAVLGYAFDTTRPSAATGWGVAGVATSAELARQYGPMEHRIIPRLELLGGSAPFWSRGEEAAPSYDIWDRLALRNGEATPAQTLSAAPDGTYAQLRVSVENRLDAGSAGKALLELGQDLDVRNGKLAESFGSASGSKGPFSTNATARVLAFGGGPALPATFKRSWLDKFTQLHFAATAHDGRGDALTATLDANGAGAVGAQGAGIDALFDLRSNGSDPYAAYTLEARTVLGGATLDYKIQLAARFLPSVGTSGNLAVSRDAGNPLQQVATLSWDSPCHCFLARARVTLDAQNKPSYRFDVDLSKILQGAGANAAGASAAPR